ncbi:tryptophan synthase beta subunit-like PLP-dependent enzyme [Blastocladiella britannica]|nr:tryptophan synthase beta subunit-like PLP-dependent enzyme [Blastocladiella britannica]
MVGNTPLIRLPELSRLTGCEIYAKAEFTNPGGSSKDRVALAILRAAEQRGVLVPHTGATVYEGTVGSTGISLAVLARALGYRCHIVMPDDVAMDKVSMLERLGATVERVRPVSIIDPGHFVTVAKRRADAHHAHAVAAHGDSVGPVHGGALFADQFENQDNWRVHFNTTGPEIWRQSAGGALDAFVMGAGTGGTLAGVARYLTARRQRERAAAGLAPTMPTDRFPDISMVLADPQGSGLFNKVVHGVLYAPTDAEGTRRRHQVDTVVEGVGLNRLTANFATGLPFVQTAERVTDQEAVDMARYMLREEGFFIGSSSAVNLVAAVRTAKRLGPGKRIVTLMCDSGVRHTSKFWDDAYLRAQGLETRAVGPSFIEDLLS